jgi:DNA-binding NarL/FixJ family response regulator
MAPTVVAAGRALRLDEAIAEALATAREATAVRHDANCQALTNREQEVAILVGRGYTNRHIAQELVVSEGTVASHVQHILAKLTLSSRAQVAAWAAHQGLLAETHFAGDIS